jgi:RND family efflux transporter MFP subunit
MKPTRITLSMNRPSLAAGADCGGTHPEPRFVPASSRPATTGRSPGSGSPGTAERRRSGLPTFCAITLGLFLVACSKPHEATAPGALPPAAVRVQKIEAVKRPALEEVVGTVQPKLEAVIEAKTSGRVTRLPVTLGQAVKQGDLLVELATQEVQARLDQAKASLRQADLEFNRFDRLRAQGATTQAEFDAAETRLNVARAAAAEAEALSGYARIVAPFDGVVSRKHADVGDLAMPGKPLLDLEGRSGLRLVADVPVWLADHVQIGVQLAVQVETRTAGLAGTVAEVSPAADPDTRTVRVKVDLPEAEGLRAGQFGRLAVPGNEATFLLAPASALVRRGQLEILFVLVEGRAQLRLVRVGKESPQGIEVLSGLAPGETVVVEGAGGLRDGQPLTIQ